MKQLRSRPFSGSGLDQVIKYLRVDLAKIFADLVEGLRHLRFEENFDSFTWSGTIDGSSSVTIPNRLGSFTLKWWPARIQGDARLVEGDISREFVVIENKSATDTTVTLLFVR